MSFMPLPVILLDFKIWASPERLMPFLPELVMSF